MGKELRQSKDVCPKCGSIFIEWNGGYYHCLECACQHKWTVWKGGPTTYKEIENPHLKASLPLHSSIPYSNSQK